MTPTELKTWRKARELTLVKAAMLLGVALSTYKKWEAGTNKITHTAEKLIAKLGDEKRPVVHVA